MPKPRKKDKPKWYVGRIGEGPSYPFPSQAEAEAAIVGASIVDPEGVLAGHYFLDPPSDDTDEPGAGARSNELGAKDEDDPISAFVLIAPGFVEVRGAGAWNDHAGVLDRFAFNHEEGDTFRHAVLSYLTDLTEGD